MKKLTKKNNKGFSLVELIVVVLIMAIIAVALAPQITKWVENSRQAKDMQTIDSLVSACQLAHTQSGLTGETRTYNIDDGNLALSKDNSFDKAVMTILGYDNTKDQNLEFASSAFEDITGVVVVGSTGQVTKNLPTLSSDLN